MVNLKTLKIIKKKTKIKMNETLLRYRKNCRKCLKYYIIICKKKKLPMKTYLHTYKYLLNIYACVCLNTNTGKHMLFFFFCICMSARIQLTCLLVVH